MLTPVELLLWSVFVPIGRSSRNVLLLWFHKRTFDEVRLIYSFNELLPTFALVHDTIVPYCKKDSVRPPEGFLVVFFLFRSGFVFRITVLIPRTTPFIPIRFVLKLTGWILFFIEVVFFMGRSSR